MLEIEGAPYRGATEVVDVGYAVPHQTPFDVEALYQRFARKPRENATVTGAVPEAATVTTWGGRLPGSFSIY